MGENTESKHISAPGEGVLLQGLGGNTWDGKGSGRSVEAFPPKGTQSFGSLWSGVQYTSG